MRALYTRQFPDCTGVDFGSNFGSNLPVLLELNSWLNGAESTVRVKFNSRTLYR
jgi:hypothetical protein